MTETPRRIPQLDGLRGLAILLVIIWHFIVAPEATHQTLFARAVTHIGVLTWSGVDLFFVLSGFLIGGILIDAKESGNYFRTFYIRRVFRILPIYFVLVVLYLLVWTVATGQRTALVETLGRPMPWLLYFTFTQNFWLAHHSWDFVYLTATWSLAVEEQFYLFLPTIIRTLPRELLLMVAVVIALGSTTSRSLLYWHYGPSWGVAAYTLFFSRADALMLGVVCAVLLRDPRWKALLIRKRWATQASCAIFGFGVAVLTYKMWGMGTMPMCTLGFTCLALFYASLLMLVVISPDGLVSRAFRSTWLIWLGTISYGLYLFHAIVMGVLSPILLHPPRAEPDWFIAVTTASGGLASIGLAWLSWNFFEARIVRLGHRFIYKNPTESPSPPPLSAVPAE